MTAKINYSAKWFERRKEILQDTKGNGINSKNVQRGRVKVFLQKMGELE